MVKFLKLLQNENKKEMKKISTKIFIFVAIFTIILAVLFVMLMKWLSNMSINYSDNYWKESIQSSIDNVKINLNDAKAIDNKQAIINLEKQIEFYQYALNNEINVNAYNEYWKVDCLNSLINQAASLSLYDADNKLQIELQNEKISKIYKIIENDDFKGYIQILKSDLKESLDNKILLQEEYNYNLGIIELREKYEIGKTNNEDEMWKTQILNDIQTIKEELKNNINSYNKKVLSFEQREELENTLKIDMYRLENDIAPISNYMGETNYRSYYDTMAESFSMLVITVLIIMMAGGAIATEYSKGTIKFLVMTPNKRWKILLAKLINIILIMIVLTIVVSLVSIVVGNIFFAGYNVSPYLFVENGEVHELNHTIYTVLRYLTDDIDILVYLLFALMLSVITRNTAAAIGVSIATNFGSNIFMALLNTFVKSDWLKFIPFNNLGLTDKIFTNTTILLPGEVSSMIGNTSVTFSLAVLGVCAVLMIVTMFDSFNKKDIK